MISTFFRLVFQGIKDLSKKPAAQIMTIAAVSLVVFLAGLFLMALATLNHQLGTIRGETAFQVYWASGTDANEVRKHWKSFTEMPHYTQMKVYTPEQALDELGKKLGRTTKKGGPFPLLAEKNPLPHTALVYFAPETDDIESWIQATEATLMKLPGVERVVTTPLRDELGQAWRKISHYIMLPSVAFLALVLGLVVGNTIRLALLSRMLEIEILKLVGAFNWYIRTPLLVGGAMLGLLGGVIGLAFLKLVHVQLQDILYFPPLLMELQFPSLSVSLALVLVPGLVGILAAWFAVRH